MRRILLLTTLASLLILPLAAAAVEGVSTAAGPATERVGVLVIAHGGTNPWDSAVRRVVRQARIRVPVHVAFGMGMHSHEVRAFQDAVNRLQRRGISRLLVVPLLVSSHSEVYRQFQYLFGARAEAVWPEAGAALSLDVPAALGHGLDDDQLLAQILLDRARTLSRTPERETVVLVSHGPNDDEENQQWLGEMKGFEAFLQQAGPFHAVVSLTIRDDAPKAVKERAVRELREAVRRASEEGRALVVPVLLAPGGIERKIPKLLAGLSYAWNGQTILPDARIAEWLAQQLRQLATSPVPPAESSAEPSAGADRPGVLQ